jgi:hypothetical protein
MLSLTFVQFQVELCVIDYEPERKAPEVFGGSCPERSSVIRLSFLRKELVNLILILESSRPANHLGKWVASAATFCQQCKCQLPRSHGEFFFSVRIQEVYSYMVYEHDDHPLSRCSSLSSKPLAYNLLQHIQQPKDSVIVDQQAVQKGIGIEPWI